MNNTIAVFCGSHLGRNPLHQSAAHRLGQLIASQGRTLVYGGSNLGYMGTVSSAALAEGGKVIGIIPDLFNDEVIYSQPGVEVQVVRSMAERKERMIAMCDSFIALPGGIGTLDEVTEVLVANQLGICCKPMGLLNIDGFYNTFLQQVEAIKTEGLMREGTEHTMLVDTTVEGLLAQLDTFTQPDDVAYLARIRRN